MERRRRRLLYKGERRSPSAAAATWAFPWVCPDRGVGIRWAGWAWLVAAPLGFILKAIGVAAVILPVGGWLALDAPTAVADLGGMLAAVVLWRTVLVRIV